MSEGLLIIPKVCRNQSPIENKHSKNVELGRGGLMFSSDSFKGKEQKSLLLSCNPYSSARSPSRDVIPSVTQALDLQGAEHCSSTNHLSHSRWLTYQLPRSLLSN